MIPFLSIEASDNYDLGFKLGLKLKYDLKRRISSSFNVYEKLGLKNLINKSKVFLPSVKKRFPQLIKELEGISDGSNTSFDDLFVLCCEEELLDYFSHCTSVALRINDSVIMGHNEDWLPMYKRNGLYLLKGSLSDDKFLALGYIGQLPGTSCGINNHGLAYSGNSIEQNKLRKGIPRSFIIRALLNVNSLSTAERVVTVKNHALPANTLMVWGGSSIKSVESLWTSNIVLKGKDYLVHTNHPLGRANHTDSIVRFKRALEILSINDFSVSTIKKILRDHKGPICSHTSSDSVTIASVIMNPNEGWLELCDGNPCENNYVRYKL